MKKLPGRVWPGSFFDSLWKAVHPGLRIAPLVRTRDHDDRVLVDRERELIRKTPQQRSTGRFGNEWKVEWVSKHHCHGSADLGAKFCSKAGTPSMIPVRGFGDLTPSLRQNYDGALHS